MRIPSRGDIGFYDEWQLEEKDTVLVVEGDLIGFGSTQEGEHTHPDDEDPLPGVQCRACRWFEVRIVAVENPDGFVLHRVGKSVIAGESMLYTPTIETSSAEGVIAALMPQEWRCPNGHTLPVRRVPEHPPELLCAACKEPMELRTAEALSALSGPARGALLLAAQYDDDFNRLMQTPSKPIRRLQRDDA